MIFYEKNLILDPLLIQVFPQLLSTLLKNGLTVPHKPRVLKIMGGNQLSDNFTVDN
jgi:hypothetical protein